MSALFIIIAVIGTVVVICVFKFLKELNIATKGQKILNEMAFSYTCFRSEGKTIEEAETAIYEKFDVPFPSYSGIFLVDQRRVGIAEENPVLFEWLTIREMAFTVHFWLKFFPRPSTTNLIMNEMYRNLSIMDFCRYLPHAISKAESQGMSPPQNLKEIATKGKEMVSEAPNSEMYSEWRESLYIIVHKSFLDPK